MRQTIEINNYPFSGWELLLLLLLSTGFLSPLVHSEVTLDGSLGPAGALTGPDYQVTENLGKRAGSNLFHSFGRFNLNVSESATFSGSASIKNVISRVTGGQTSNIDGTLRVSIPNANLYLLNPAGVIFGEHAKLDLSGSFHASTADYLKFQDGVRFDSGTATAPQVLSTAAPEAFGFLGDNPAPISFSGNAGSVFEVQQGSTISLIGGDITIDNMAIYAPGGQINIASVGSEGEVILTESGIQTTSFERMGEIRISQNPLIPRFTTATGRVVRNLDVSDNTAGKVFIRGGQLVMENSIIASNTVNGNGGGINVELTGDLNLGNTNAVSAITSTTVGKGHAGNINLDVADLNLTNGAQIDTRTLSLDKGNAGDLSIKANIMEVSDGAIITSSALDGGESGELNINASSLKVNKGAVIFNITNGIDNGGNLMIEADTVEVDGASIFAHSGGIGNGGVLNINTGSLKVNNGAFISNTTNSTSITGIGGDLMIKADTVEVDGATISSGTAGARNSGELNINTRSLIVNNGALISNITNSTGNGGDLAIKADHLDVYNNSIISTSTLGDGDGGDGGNININARKMAIYDNSHLGAATGIGSIGPSGDLTIKADHLDVYNKSSISSFTLGKGYAGNLNINANKIAIRESSHLAASTAGIGPGGDVTLVANDIILSDNSTVQSTSGLGDIDSSSAPEIAGSGDINITLGGTLRLKNNSRISTVTTSVNAGNITINNGKLVHLSNESAITTRVLNNQGTGGNIFINTPIVALDNSVIGAQAAEGQGGNITIKGFLFQSPSSLVTASSKLGIDGEINLKPDTNISGSLAVLPDTFMNASQQMSERCVARLGNNMSSFVVKGRGGVPLRPGDFSPSNFQDYLSPERHSPHGKESLDHGSSYLGEGKSPQFASMNIGCTP